MQRISTVSFCLVMAAVSTMAGAWLLAFRVGVHTQTRTQPTRSGGFTSFGFSEIDKRGRVFVGGKAETCYMDAMGVGRGAVPVNCSSDARQDRLGGDNRISWNGVDFY